MNIIERLFGQRKPETRNNNRSTRQTSSPVVYEARNTNYAHEDIRSSGKSPEDLARHHAQIGLPLSTSNYLTESRMDDSGKARILGRAYKKQAHNFSETADYNDFNGMKGSAKELRIGAQGSLRDAQKVINPYRKNGAAERLQRMQQRKHRQKPQG